MVDLCEEDGGDGGKADSDEGAAEGDASTGLEGNNG